MSSRSLNLAYLPAAALAVTVPCAAYFLAATPPPTLTHPPAKVVSLIVPNSGSAVFDLGVVAGGSRVDFPCVVRNDTAGEVKLGPFRTSCDCLSVVVPSGAIPPGGHATGVAVVDMGKDPKFSGRLALTAEAAVLGSAGAGLSVDAVLAVDVR